MQTESHFLHCVTPPLVLLHVWCCPSQSLSVYTFTCCANVLTSTKHLALGTPFKCRSSWCMRKSERFSCRWVSAVVVFGFCGVSTTARRFSSDDLCAYTTPSSVLTRCSSVRSLLPIHTRRISICQPASARDSHILFPPLEGEQAQIHQTPAPLHVTIDRGLCVVALEARNEPSGVSNNLFHQVLCAVL